MPQGLQTRAKLLLAAEDHSDRAKYREVAEIWQMKKNRHLSKVPNQQVQDQGHLPDYSELQHWHYDKNRIGHNPRQKGKKLLRKA